VDKPLQSIATVAARGDVDSVNMLLEPMWPRLWANSMLLNKHQYFRTHTYEGRRATRLRGAWDLRDGLLAIDAGGADTIKLGGGYHLVRRAGTGGLQFDLGPGWLPSEGGGGARWVWSSGREAVLRLTNPGAVPVRVRLGFGLQGNGVRSIAVAQDGRADPLWTGTITATTSPVALAAIVLPPGETFLRIRSAEPAFAPPGDGRELGFALHDMTATIEGETRHDE
jgi:hypothetical protein